jgi:glutamate dehydrogenase (NAD(P)+)
MAWVMDQYSRYHGHSPAVVTGKPIDLYGSRGRDSATGRGILLVSREILHDIGMGVKGTRFAVQGFGNVGANLARLLHLEGAKIVAVSDSRGGVYNPDGLDVSAALAHKQEHGVLTGLSNAEPVTNEELVELPCDILAPCALEQVITEENADRVKARVICEGANGPVTPSADAILEDRGVLVLPDVLANAGGVVVSYFEWVQGLQEYFWREEEVNAKLHDIVARAFEEAWETRESHDTSLRMASYGLAVQRVAEATTIRGLYP